ncbi:F-box/FBD/LRR-repeat protein At1g13570-like [Rutidosis leptorrhynchoides]|uniref:F-box/FBD/LRR-repeat protein At1g13570-like n=1 Tax=Rutidosis leptorrhynchoides TaxID=125765 RepID=UPI003A99CA1C
MKNRRLRVDRLSTLPPNIIEKILCLVPIREAGRTCILSKIWRYTWTKIPKLVFDEDTFQVSDEDKFFYVIYQILLLHQGPILEFSLCISEPVDEDDTCVEVDPILRYLSRMNTVKKLRLGNLGRIPSYIFSLQQLTDLYLHQCCIQKQVTFNGFSSITTLTIDDTKVSKKTLVHLLSKCPLLQTFSLLRGHDQIHCVDDSGLVKLFECLPVIENLTFDLWCIKCVGEHKHPRELATSLYHLKYMCLYGVQFGGNFHYGMPFLALLLRASPNLEKIKLSTFTYTMGEETDSYVDEELDYSDIELKNLSELEIEEICYRKPELELVKFMLMKSPLLKTLKIIPNQLIREDEELEMLNIFRSCPRASPMVEISLHHVLDESDDDY